MGVMTQVTVDRSADLSVELYDIFSHMSGALSSMFIDRSRMMKVDSGTQGSADSIA